MLSYLIEKPHIIAANLSFVSFVWFLFLAIFTDRKYKASSFILMMAWLFYCVAISNKWFEHLSYVDSKGMLISIDGVTALILVMFMFFDKMAWKQALILAFAVLCHTMIIYDLTIASSMLSNFFYSYYDELIIMVAILQLTVSYDGFIRAYNSCAKSLGGIQERLFRIWVYFYCLRESLFAQKTRDKKA